MKNLLSAILVLVGANCAFAQLQPNDHLAITGDSITEQKMYSVYIEDYLLACKPVANASTMQFGWGGEKMSGFQARMQFDCLQFKPTIATTCYGMNDGEYTKMTDAIGERYRASTEAALDAFTKAGVRVVLGSPGCVDSTAFKRPNTPADVYNATLAAERDIDKEIAAKHNLPFADVYQAMFDTMKKAKEKYGDNYSIAGNDGVHPYANGHLVMAYAFLKALGCSGDIGTITVDLGATKATASDGHKVQSFEGDTLMIESSKYPFCFPGDTKLMEHLEDPKNPRGVLPFLPFNSELNRFVLIVTNAPSANVKVSWGSDSKTFSADQLAKGINLADEFLDNPLSSQFARLDAAVHAQQNAETPLFKTIIHETGLSFKDDAEFQQAIANAVTKKQQVLAKAAADAVLPVTHMIRIQAVQ